MTASLRGRGEFQRLRAEGRRFGAGVTWCVHRPDATRVPPRIAFGISRSVGTAVVRNRIRRRLRAIIAEQVLPPGDYLFGVSPAASTASFAELRSLVMRLVARCAEVARP